MQPPAASRYVAQRKPLLLGLLAPLPPHWALNVEKTRVVLVLPHWEHTAWLVACDRVVKRSNVVSHSSQWYSKIGIAHSYGTGGKLWGHAWGLMCVLSMAWKKTPRLSYRALHTAHLDACEVVSQPTVRSLCRHHLHLDAVLVYLQVVCITRSNLECIMQRILVIRGGAVGDVILTLPALGALRSLFPHAMLEVWGDPTRLSVAHHPRYADHIVDRDQWPLYQLLSTPPHTATHLTTYLSTFDGILSYLPDADLTFLCNLQRYCHGQVLAWSPHPPADRHVTEHLLQPVRQFGTPAYAPCPRIYLTAEAQDAAERFWHAAGLPADGVIAFHPGSGGRYKLWPDACWEEVMTASAQRGYPGLLISGPAEHARQVAGPTLAACAPWPRAHHLPLPHLAAILARCRLMVGHDAGITHLAAAVGIPVLALFGPTDPQVWGPRSPQACILQPTQAATLTQDNMPPAVVWDVIQALWHGTFRFTPSHLECTIRQVSA